MNKLIKTFSVISLILSSLAILLFLGFLTILWEPVNEIFNTPEIIIKEGPAIPIGSVIYLSGYFVVSMLLLFSRTSSKSIAPEIISAILLIVALPVLSYFASYTQSIMVGRYIGIETLEALSTTDNIGQFPMYLAKLCCSLSLVNCGIKITVKKTLNV